MKKAAVVFLLLLLAPAPWGIALNHDTRECAGYWGGDEYIGYTLPEGWQAYYPDASGSIQTEIGSCRWGDWDYEKRVEQCCQVLGYRYVSSNIGEKHGGLTTFSAAVIAVTAALGLGVLCIVVVFFVGLGLLIRRARRKRLSQSL